jgi:hypothetical protein
MGGDGEVVHPVAAGDPLPQLVAGEVGVDERELAIAPGVGEVRRGRRVTVGVAAVEDDDLEAADEQRVDQVRADEPGRAGDQYPAGHVSSVPTRVRTATTSSLSDGGSARGSQ